MVGNGFQNGRDHILQINALIQDVADFKQQGELFDLPLDGWAFGFSWHMKHKIFSLGGTAPQREKECFYGYMRTAALGTRAICKRLYILAGLSTANYEYL
jgi:hypothetical protein